VIKHSSFNNSGTQDQTTISLGFISLTYFTGDVLFDDVVFENTQSRAGLIYMEDNQARTATFNACTFQKITTATTGVLTVDKLVAPSQASALILKVIGCHFEDCQAGTLGTDIVALKGAGAGLFIQNPEVEVTDCQFIRVRHHGVANDRGAWICFDDVTTPLHLVVTGTKFDNEVTPAIEAPGESSGTGFMFNVLRAQSSVTFDACTKLCIGGLKVDVGILTRISMAVIP
jgi:hypothetical protein